MFVKRRQKKIKPFQQPETHVKTVQWFAIAMSALALVACSKTEAKPLTIGAIYLDAQGFYAGVRAGVTDGIGSNAKLLDTNAQGDVAKESQFVSTLISTPVNALIMSAVSPAGSLRAVEQAHKANIPVICYNTCLSAEKTKELVYAYVVGDPFTSGEKLGEAAAAYFTRAGVKAPRIGVLNCEFVDVCVQRRKGFEAALIKQLPGAKVVANQEGTTVDKAVTTGEKMLIANPGLDAFLGESGGATLGAVKAVKNQNKVGKTAVFGWDMSAEAANDLIDGTVLKGVADISGKALGKLAAQQALAATRGEKRADVIVPASIDMYLNADSAKGWLGTHKDGLP
ncbi:substrate-binding domain-containing protein [Paraburkholderia caffeinilytica]|uniref:substrate-binding domain-containing protein n=1 Tax=Paraburkholderia caffeinilytica TaxID=1761016 RepID=UPI0038B914CB